MNDSIMNFTISNVEAMYPKINQKELSWMMTSY